MGRKPVLEQEERKNIRNADRKLKRAKTHANGFDGAQFRHAGEQKRDDGAADGSVDAAVDDDAGVRGREVEGEPEG